MASMHDDLALYVLGALDDPREFEAHLATCEACRTELAEIRGTLDVLDAGIVRTPAPIDLRAKTLAAIRETDVRGPEVPQPAEPIAPPSNVVSLDQARLRRARFVSIAAVAALAVVVAGIGYRSFVRDGFSADRSILLSAVDGGSASGEARIDDTDAGQVIELTVEGLPDAPSGTHYECWWVGPNDADDIQDRVSAGTFRSGEGTFRMQSAADPSRFTKMGVTLEPDDGNPARTGEKVLVSQPPAGASAPANTTPIASTTPSTAPPASTGTPASP